MVGTADGRALRFRTREQGSKIIMETIALAARKLGPEGLRKAQLQIAFIFSTHGRPVDSFNPEMPSSDR
jgi:hypothetical protein